MEGRWGLGAMGPGGAADPRRLPFSLRLERVSCPKGEAPTFPIWPPLLTPFLPTTAPPALSPFGVLGLWRAAWLVLNPLSGGRGTSQRVCPGGAAWA